MFLKRIIQIIIIGFVFCLVYNPVLSDNVSAIIRTTATVASPAGIIPYSTYNNKSDQQFVSLSDNLDFTTDNNLFFLWEPSNEYVINFQIDNGDENIFFQLNQDFKYLEKVQSSGRKSSLSLINLNSIDEKLPFDYSHGVITLISIDN